MPEEPFNPYAPPHWGPPPAGGAGGRRRWAEGLARVAAVVLGFGLVADPTSLPGVNTRAVRAVGGHVFARGVGLALLGIGFVPWRWGRRGRPGGGLAGEADEEL